MNRRQFLVAASAALVSSSVAPQAFAMSGDRDYSFNFGSVFNTRQASRYRGKEIVAFKTKEAPGVIRLTVKHPALGTRTVELRVHRMSPEQTEV